MTTRAPKTVRPGIHVEIPQTAFGRVTIRTARDDDQPYLVRTHYAYRKRVGWFTAPGFYSAIARNLVWMFELNGQPCGYQLISGGIHAPLTLRHNCVDSELWRHGLGTEWVSAYLRYGRSLYEQSGFREKLKLARVRTRNDITDQLAINLHTGGELVGVDEKVGSTGRPVTIWEWPLASKHLALIEADHRSSILAGVSETVPRCGLHPHKLAAHARAVEEESPALAHA